MTLREWLNIWLETYKRLKISKQCYKDYQSCINMYLGPILDIELCDMKGLYIQQCINNILAKRRRVITYQILNNAFKYAMGNNFIEYNPLLAVDIIRPKRNIRRVLLIEEEEHLFNACNSDNFKALLLFYIETGVRRAEALTIEVKDIDMNNNCIYVHGTKSENAVRIVPISQRLKGMLSEFYPMSKRYLFSFSKDYLTRKFKEICQRANIKNLCLHCLRHTFATRCIEKGIDAFVVKTWLGHADIQTTLNVYTHMTKDMTMQSLTELNAKKL